MNTPLPEYVPFPLYHGTSTVWEHSIRMHGLGGRRIIEELHALEFHRRARACLKSVPEGWPVGTVLTMERIEAQSLTGGSFNFRHGGLYLTPSRQTATRYAVHNPFGSELLTHCHLLYEAHANATEEPIPAWFPEYAELIAVLKNPGNPILIRVSHVRTAELTDESGHTEPRNLGWLLDLIAESDAETARENERAEFLREAIQNEDAAKIAELIAGPRKTMLSVPQIIEVLGQQANFEAKAVIPAADLEFEQIKTADSPAGL